MTFSSIYVLGPAIYFLMIVLFIQLVNRSWKRNAPYSYPFMMLDRGLIITICQPILKKTICTLMAIEGSPNRTALAERTLSLELSSITLEHVQTTLYLDLQLQKLQWEAYVQKLCWNIFSKLAVLSRLRKSLNNNYFVNSISHAYNLVLTMPFLSGLHAQSKPKT